MSPRFKSAWAVLVMSAAASSLSADLPQIQKRGTLRVLVVNDGLFFNLKPGALPGFDHEVLDGFCAMHRLELEVLALDDWNGMIPALLAGKGDLIAGGYAATEARRKQIEFSREVFPARKVVITRKPHRVITTLEQLRQERVGTVKGTSMEEAVRAADVPAANVEYAPSGTLPQGLRDGKFEAAVLGVEHVIIEKRQDPELQIGLFLGQPGSQAFGLRPQDRELKAALDDYIGRFRQTPSWSRLVVKYLGESAPDILKRARE